MAPLRVSVLQPPEIDDALVLAGLGPVDIDANAWRRETVALMADPARGGVLIARSETDRACGLLHYRIVAGPDAGAEAEPRSRPSLEVLRLVAFALMEPHLIAGSLIAEAMRLARLQDCDSLRLVRPLDRPADASALVLASGLAILHSVF